MFFSQGQYDLRCGWAMRGLAAIGTDADAVVIVDVLSFSTAVDVAVSRGASVFPYRWNDASAAAFAAERGAVLAGSRRAGGPYTLSPASLRSIPRGTRLVLPSPNGSALAAVAGDIPVFTACLRNAPAVARRVAECGQRIAVVAAGEHWADGALRPCLEDWIGAGAVLAELRGSRSPEAKAAIAAFRSVRDDLAGALSECGSGRELVERGFAEDVEMAAKYAISDAAPTLRNGEFVDP